MQSAGCCPPLLRLQGRVLTLWLARPLCQSHLKTPSWIGETEKCFMFSSHLYLSYRELPISTFLLHGLSCTCGKFTYIMALTYGNYVKQSPPISITEQGRLFTSTSLIY